MMSLATTLSWSSRFPLLISFMEGAAVMVIELVGAKAIAPYYGTSLYVWAAVLGIAISALALGYFWGGRMSERHPPGRSLSVILILGAMCTALTQYLGPIIGTATASLDVRVGSLLVASLYLLGPIFCMGAISPLIIQLIHRDGAAAGQSAGVVYAVSTVGGILATFLAGFYLIPQIGIRATTFMTSALLAVIGLACLAFGLPRVAREPVPDRGAAGHRVLPQQDPLRSIATGAASATLPATALLTISFIEGWAVMATELLGAKITAPYFGASLYVWASVLGVTLAALAAGYAVGGRISRSHAGEVPVFVALLLAGLLTAIAPLIAPPVLLAVDALGLRLGSLIAVLVYLLPPLACMGAVSPLVTQLICRHPGMAGRAAGTVYATATAGGILGTFLAGFYLIPATGIRATALLIGALLGGTAIGYFLNVRRLALAATGFALAMATVALQPAAVESPGTRVLYNTSGILGQWMVIDRGPWPMQDNVPVVRRLLLNGIDQTYTQVGFQPLSLWKYPHKIAAYASMKPAGSKVLLLGMGGGSIAYELKEIGMDLDIVELDERLREIDVQFFRYDPDSSRMFIDDARHFLRTTPETYDVVVIDLLIGEVQPTHMFSIEGFADLAQRLAEDAIVIINFQGYMNESAESLGPRSIYKTLQAAGFFVNYYASASDKDLVQDIFFLASRQDQDYRTLMRDLRYNKWFRYDRFEYKDLIREDPPSLQDAHVLTDDKPRLELLNAPIIMQWRRDKVQEHLRPLLEHGVPIYN